MLPTLSTIISNLKAQWAAFKGLSVLKWSLCVFIVKQRSTLGFTLHTKHNISIVDSKPEAT